MGVVTHFALWLLVATFACRPRAELTERESELIGATGIGDSNSGHQNQHTNSSNEKSPMDPTAVQVPKIADSGFPKNLWLDPESQAAKTAKILTDTAAPDAAAITAMAKTPTAMWYGEWSGNIRDAALRQTQAVAQMNQTGIAVIYNIPYRNCIQSPAVGSTAAADYRLWMQQFSSAIAGAYMMVILEPEVLTLNDCVSTNQVLLQERYDLLNFAVVELKKNPKTRVYIDAGYAGRLKEAEIAMRLGKAGIKDADGFALNVANFQLTEASKTYGLTISQMVEGKPFVIDTSRNGNGPAADNAKCNPPGRGLGLQPMITPGLVGVDAFLWIKRPGESDGPCLGNPPAGQWSTPLALDLIKNKKP